MLHAAKNLFTAEIALNYNHLSTVSEFYLQNPMKMIGSWLMGQEKDTLYFYILNNSVMGTGEHAPPPHFQKWRKVGDGIIYYLIP